METLRSSAAIVIVSVAVSASARSDAQIRPAVPEVRCTQVSLVARVGSGAHRREVGLRIVNDDGGDFTAHIRRDIDVESFSNGRWRRVGVAGLQVRSECRARPDACVAIAPRDAVEIVAWTGMLGDGQCECTRCAPAPAGRYRFVVHSCENCQAPREAASAPFDLPAP
jgi:hypothetical protein